MFLSSIIYSCTHSPFSETKGQKSKAQNHSPGNDFFEWQNHTWLDDEKNIIPEDQSSWGAFTILREQSLDNQIAIMDALRSSTTKDPNTENLAVIYDRSLARFDDWEKGLKSYGAVKSELHKIEKVFGNNLQKENYIHALARYASHALISGIRFPFAFSSMQDLEDSQNEKLSFFGGGHILPERNYYFDKKYASQRKTLLEHLDKTYKLISREGFSLEQDFAKKVFEFDALIAKYSMTGAQKRLYDQYYSKTNLNGVYEKIDDLKFLQKKLDNYPSSEKVYELTKAEKNDIQSFMKQWYETLDIPNILKENYKKNYKIFDKEKANMLIVFDGDYMRRVLSLILKQDKDNKSRFKAYLQYQAIKSISSFSSKELHDEFFDFYAKQLAGQKKQKSAKKQSVALLNNWVDEALGQLYVKKHFSEKSKQNMQEMVNNILEATRNSLTNSTWLSKKTKEKALAKLTKFTVKIAYPEKWQDYSSLQLKRSMSLYEISTHVNEFDFRENFLKKINAPHDKSKWAMSPQTVNAYYSPSSNEIVFPAAILQSPFFQSNLNEVKDSLGQEEESYDFDPIVPINYGGIGAVIAHEITHGYDDQGRKFDAEGNLVDWWTEDDLKAFTARANVILEQTENYSFFDNSENAYKMDGQLTMGENLADLGGLTLALRALHSVKDPKSNKNLYKNKKATKLFFRSWANIWKEKAKEEIRIQKLSSDPHAPTNFRGNLLRNLDDFYSSFDIKKNEPMYLAPEKRVRMW